MKIQKIISRSGIIAMLFMFIAFTGCEKDDPDTPPIKTLDSIISITELRDLYQGSPVTFDENTDVSFFGTITMDDSSGNIYNQAFIQDQEAGIMLRIFQAGNLSQGDSVRVQLRGTTLSDYRDLLQLEDVDGSANIVVQASERDLQPMPLTIEEIITSNDLYQSMFIRLDGVQFTFTDAGSPWADAENQRGINRTLQDCDGYTLAVYTSGFADFASELTPEGNGFIQGVLGKHDGMLQLHIRDSAEAEMDMEGERCDPVDDDLDLLTLAEVKELFEDGATSLPPNTRIEGTIISDRNHENLPGQNAFMMDEHGDGIALRFQGWHSLEYNTKVSISTGTIAIERFNGLLQITDIPLGNAIPVAPGELPEPSIATLGDIINDFQTYESTVVTIENVIIPHGGTFAGNVLLDDGTGEVNMYTTAWASFADEPVEGGIYHVTGIASVYHSPQILIRSLDDLEFVEEYDDNGNGDEDAVTFIDEDFQSYPDHDPIDQNGWTSIAEEGNRVWICRVFDNDHYAQATAHNSDDNTNIMWLITPAINLDEMTEPVFEFQSAQAYYSHDGFSLHISFDFDGSDVTQASWEPLDARLAEESDAEHAWIDSGNINLSAFDGIAHIAWRYEGSAPQGNSGSFRVNNVLLQDNAK